MKLVLSQAGIAFENTAGTAGQFLQSLGDCTPVTVSVGYDADVQADVYISVTSQRLSSTARTWQLILFLRKIPLTSYVLLLHF